jgi:hypothetical protein
MKWEIIDTDLVDSSKFGLTKVHACKVAKWTGKSDIRTFQLKGWVTYAELTDTDPINGEQLKSSQWFIYAAIGR